MAEEIGESASVIDEPPEVLSRSTELEPVEAIQGVMAKDERAVDGDGIAIDPGDEGIDLVFGQVAGEVGRRIIGARSVETNDADPAS